MQWNKNYWSDVRASWGVVQLKTVSESTQLHICVVKAFY